MISIRRSSILLLIPMALAMLSACHDGELPTATSPGAAALAVVPSGVGSVSVLPQAPSLNTGATLQFTATVRNSAGTALPKRKVTWSSGNPAIATVSAKGLATAVATGTVTLTARSGSALGTATLTVTAAVAAVAITPGSTTVAFVGPYGSAVWTPEQLTAAVTDAQGNVLNRAVTWASSNTGIATVDGTGKVSGVSPGLASVTATVDGIISNIASVCVGGGVTDFVLTPGSGPQPPPTLYLSVAATASCGQTNAPFRYLWACQGTNTSLCNAFLAVVNSSGLYSSYEFPLDPGEIYNIGVMVCLYTCSAPRTNAYDGAVFGLATSTLR